MPTTSAEEKGRSESKCRPILPPKQSEAVSREECGGEERTGPWAAVARAAAIPTPEVFFEGVVRYFELTPLKTAPDHTGPSY